MRWLTPVLLLAGASFVGAQDAGRAEGRKAYLSLACWQCHSQEKDRAFPAIAGTRMAGPVLDTVPLARSREWHLAHFAHPRAVVAESVMPSYAHLFSPDKNAAAVAAFIREHDKDGDGIVTRREATWPEGLDRSGNGILSEADAVPVPGPEIEAVVGYLLTLTDPPLAPAAAPKAPKPQDPKPQDREQAVRRGEALFARHCAGCHGERADGNGKVAAFFGNHPPRNFVKGEYRYRSTRIPDPPTDEDLFATIRRGAGPSMPAWPGFTDAQVWDLVEFLKSNHPGYLPRELKVEGADIEFTRESDDAAGTDRITKRGGRWYWDDTEITDGMRAGDLTFRLGKPVFDWLEDYEPRVVELPKTEIPYTRASADKGALVYKEFGCAECHGEQGKGDGVNAEQTRGSLGQTIRPSDYTRGAAWLKGGADARSLVRGFVTGLHGTPMPAYASNFKAARAAAPDKAPWHLAHFVMRQAGIPFPR